jgi:hypothetical protein
MEEHSLTSNTTFLTKFKIINWEDSFNRKVFYFRLAAFSILVSLLLLNSYTGYLLPIRSPDCVWDAMFVYTEGMNKYLSENSEIKDCMITVSSLLIDILLIDFGIRWILFGTTWRPILFILLFYTSRALIQKIFIMQFPNEYLWSYPGFPSVSVSYNKTSDFFFSGHAGIMTFCALENYSCKRLMVTALAVIGTGYVATVMILTRGHYTIDILTGIVLAHYFWIISGWLSEELDKSYARRRHKYLEI